MVNAWKKEDPPPNRVKPVPIRVIRHIANLAHSSIDINNHYRATADMIILAFFFLLRPGEYIDSNSESSPFRLEDVQLFIGDARLCLQTSPPERLRRASFASLTFTNQKNGVRGEVIGLSRSGDPILCPVRTIIRRVLYLRTNNAPPSTPLARTYNTKRVTASSITTILRESVAFFGPQIGFLPSDVSARCLRAAGATALLLGRVDTDIISLIGRWRSDEMLRYPLDEGLLPKDAKCWRLHLDSESTCASTLITTNKLQHYSSVSRLNCPLAEDSASRRI